MGEPLKPAFEKINWTGEEFEEVKETALIMTDCFLGRSTFKIDTNCIDPGILDDKMPSRCLANFSAD